MKNPTKYSKGTLQIIATFILIVLFLFAGVRFFGNHTFSTDCQLIERAVEEGGAFTDRAGWTWSEIDIGANGSVFATKSHPHFEASPDELLGDMNLDLGTIDIGGASLDLNELTGLDKIEEVTLGYQQIRKNYDCPGLSPP